MTVALNREVQAALSALAKRDISHVFLIGCGGSLSIMHAGKYFLDRPSARLSCDLYNSDEFVCRDPARLGPGALVLLCSQTGATAETVRAAMQARERGALTVGMTLDPSSPLAKNVDVVAPYRSPYTTGVPIDPANSNYAVLLSVLALLLEVREGRELRFPAQRKPGTSRGRHRSSSRNMGRQARGLCAAFRQAGRHIHACERRRFRGRLLVRHLRSNGDAAL